MKWVKSNENKEVLEFPYNINEIRQQNPNTSFPKVFSKEFLAERHVYEVIVKVPEFNHMHEYIVPSRECTWDEDAQIFTSTYTIERQPYTTVEIAAKQHRNQLLAETDFYALSDTSEMPENVRLFRQALRDLSTHENWPYLNTDDWPLL
jgi:hypothetical protein